MKRMMVVMGLVCVLGVVSSASAVTWSDNTYESDTIKANINGGRDAGYGAYNTGPADPNDVWWKANFAMGGAGTQIWSAENITFGQYSDVSWATTNWGDKSSSLVIKLNLAKWIYLFSWQPYVTYGYLTAGNSYEFKYSLDGINWNLVEALSPNSGANIVTHDHFINCGDTKTLYLGYFGTNNGSGNAFLMEVKNVANEDMSFYCSSNPPVEVLSFSPEGGIFSTSPLVTINCSVTGAQIHYTLDGSEPTESSPVYTNPILIEEVSILKARAWASGAPVSEIHSGDYTFTNQVAAVQFSPNGGYLSIPTNITLSCATAGAVIHYTQDGTEPTTSSPTYNGQIFVDHAQILKAKAWAAGFWSSQVRTAEFTFPVCNCPAIIPYTSGGVTVDGNLTEWSNAEWAPIDHIYDSNPSDIAEAYYAAKWSANKVYVAVKVRDTAHHFTDSYDDWNTRDAVEIYLHTTGFSNDHMFADSEPAQQLSLGIQNTDRDAVWANLGYKMGIPASGYDFQAAGCEVGSWLYYEAELTPYEYMGGFKSQSSIVSPLTVGEFIGLDVVVTGNNGGYTGMKSENDIIGSKSVDYTLFGMHKLGKLAGDANGDGMVDVGDLGILAANYGGSGKGWSQGDFNGDGLVDVGDLGILAAHYGTNASSADWSADYAKAFGTAVADENEAASATGSSVCGAMGLPLIATLVLMGLMLVKLEE